MKSPAQRGVALVITLIMLAVVTLMAITFLAISRRERSSVAVTEDQTTSRLMAEAAVARARSEIFSRMLQQGSPLAYDLAVSTNYIAPYGYDPNAPLNADGVNLTNINYERLVNGGAMNEAQRLQNIANLQLDPRAPVFVATGTTNDFRFYLDLNRNRRFETNGWWPALDFNGRPIGSLTNRSFYVGDPEWIGVLQYPDRPHSRTNRMIGRYAYLVLPAGKSLDWNFIHNHAQLAMQDEDLRQLGYYRNQGVGSWELNLAGFLRELNNAVWTEYAYSGLRNSGAGRILPSGNSFQDALGFLRYRYGGKYSTLLPATEWFFRGGTPVAALLEQDGIDTYTDGPHFGTEQPLATDLDPVRRPWVGSDNYTNYFELNELFDTNKVPASFVVRLLTTGNQLASFDRYTFYRLMGQIGMESGQPSRTKINLNYDNAWPYDATNMVPWTPIRFFQVTADRLIQASRMTNFASSGSVIYTNYFLGEHRVRGSLSVTNIQIYPYNEYSPVLHRLLQLTVNLYDATTNRTETDYPYLPTVFRPLFGSRGTNLFITGYTEVTNANFLRTATFRDLNVPADRLALANDPNAVVYNVPFLIGAKKGFPNFNEFALQNVAQVTRKAQVRKRLEGDRVPFQTNVMYLLSISNQFGIEAWNSYTQDFGRTFRVQAAGVFTVMVTNRLGAGSVLRLTNVPYAVTYTNQTWPGLQYRLPILRSVVVVSNEVYQPVPLPTLVRSGTNVNFVPSGDFYMPDWGLLVSNRFYYAMVDETRNRLIDFVCLGNMTAQLDITREIVGRAQLPQVLGAAVEPANVWLTNRVDNSFNRQVPTEGVVNQMDISLGNLTVSQQQWRSYNSDAVDGQDKAKSIDLFREFCGLTPLVYTSARDRQRLTAELRGKLAYQAPYSPTRKIYTDISWQVNDPLVHYLLGDLLDPYNRPNDPNRTNAVRFAVPPQIRLTNVNLGLMNERYRPWGGNPNQSVDLLARSVAVKDPLVRRSDDWDFPGYKLPNVGWIGRVHRGTPWQTFYLKPDLVGTNLWYQWAGSQGTHPTNDWGLVELFTTAPNDNAARGALGVNQTNTAAWAAVLAGVSILVPTNSTGGFVEYFLEQAPTNLWQTGTSQANIRRIVEGINRTRGLESLQFFGRQAPYFHQMGRILATPELTYGSSLSTPGPDGSYARTLPFPGRDELVERIPQQVLSLLKEDEPRFVVYAFGQALKEAPNSLYLGSGPFNRLCTNYQVTAEFVTKSVIRIDDPLLNPRAVVESYNELLSE